MSARLRPNQPWLVLFGVTLMLGFWACSDRAPANPDFRSQDSLVAKDSRIDVAPDGPIADRSAPDVPRPPDRAGEATRDLGVDATPSAWQLSTIATVDLHAVACVQGHVFVAGDKGTLLHRASGSTSFKTENVGTTADLYTVTFADLTYGVTAGKNPQIWETKNQGQTWAVAPQCSAFVFEAFYALHLYSATEGFGAGIANNNQGAGYKYYSGYSWVCPYTLYAGEVFYDVVRQAGNGWLVGSTGGKIYRSVDQGMSWTPVTSGTTKVLRGLARSSVGTLIAVGDGGTILRSADGKGTTWTAVPSGVTTTLRDVAFQGTTAFAVGESGVLLKGTSEGQTWTARAVPTKARLEGICFASGQEGWAVGAGGVLLHTTTGG